MNENHRETLSIFLTTALIILTLYVIHRFIPALIWAGIISISTYPLYKYWKRLLGERNNLAALSFTIILTLFFLVPLSWASKLLIKELQVFISYIQHLNHDGGEVPSFLPKIPLVGTELTGYWHNHFSKPGFFKSYLANIHFNSAPLYIKKIGYNLMHRGVLLGFTIFILFFFFRDAQKLALQIDRAGRFCLGRRFSLYADNLPRALRAVVNGTIIVGLGVGLLMWLCYLVLDFPAPALAAWITAIASMIPFAVPIIFIVIALTFIASNHILSAIILLIWGTLVMFVADHFVKPALIGGATKLPFLAVLLGILGGLETLGVLGLFIGPVIMLMFITLWNELQLNYCNKY